MSKTRREFLADSGKAAMVGTAIFASAGLNKEKPMEKIFIHHVYFWLNDPGNQDDTSKLIEGLRKLSAVKLIQQFHIGKPASTPRDVVDNSYAVSWMVLFANAEDQASYQVDPIHLKFVDENKHLWKKVIVYDTIDA